ncbi:hypothetical protein LguiA_002805 [Lonicera macranthoides]
MQLVLRVHTLRESSIRSFQKQKGKRKNVKAFGHKVLQHSAHKVEVKRFHSSIQTIFITNEGPIHLRCHTKEIFRNYIFILNAITQKISNFGFCYRHSTTYIYKAKKF